MNTGKRTIPVEATMVYDGEALDEELSKLLKELKILIQDQKDASKNVYDGE